MHAREGTRVVFHAANIFTLSMGTAREREGEQNACLPEACTGRFHGN